MMTEGELGVLVDGKLREHASGVRPEYAAESALSLTYHGVASLESYCALLRTFKAPVHGKRRELPEQSVGLMLELLPALGRIWNLVPRDPRDDGTAQRETAERSFAYGLDIAIQRHRDHFVSSEVWRREIAAIGDRDRWLALAADHEASRRLYQANAALAAARWIDLSAPAAARTAAAAAEIVRGRRDAAVPEPLRGHLRPGFRAESVHRRHWLAWDMKNRGMLDVPSLIAHACDENFWVRARVYRSLGQQPMVASVHVLLEGLLDPHRFARAQAARSLGWIGAPVGLDRLLRLAADDPSPEVRRAARQAAERIASYWVLYGEARPRAAELGRWSHDTARRLASQDLSGAAGELLVWDPDAGIDRAAHDALARALEPFSFALTKWAAVQEYNLHSEDAEAFDAAVARTDPEREPDDMMALYAVSRHRRGAARAADLASAPGALGWNARRALRALRLPWAEAAA
jgi:hypothetical protein